MRVISKSRFISGVQCHKKIWFDYYRKDLRLPIDSAQQRVFDLGHEISKMAQKVFPGGKDATPENFYNLNPAAIQTRIWLEEGIEIIYEATFIAGNATAILDILHRKGNKLHAIEVKNSTEVKDYHLQDAALQYFVMSKAGYQPDCFYLMHVNNKYVKDGKITDEFFIMHDITETVKSKQQWVAENLGTLLDIVQLQQEPVVSIGTLCGSPFDCDYRHHCWSHIPEKSVFDLALGRKKIWDLYEKNILKLEDIPEDYPLSCNQLLQVNGVKNGKEVFEKENIQKYLNSWEFPLHHFDFETIYPAIPILNGTSPYQQIPFQYSLHIQNEDRSIVHKEFLAEPMDFINEIKDPRKKMIEQMKHDFGIVGSVVTYNMSFEKNRLTELAKDFPEDSEFLNGILSRLVDLLPIFKKRWYYKPAMGKSASIKSVLPAIVPHLSYHDMEIKNGEAASDAFLQSILTPAIYTAKLRKSLLKYCEMDTWAMVEIYNHLNRRNV